MHIADVTHFVKPDTALDLEAADRCTTVYLTDKVHFLLPGVMWFGVCLPRAADFTWLANMYVQNTKCAWAHSLSLRGRG